MSTDKQTFKQKFEDYGRMIPKIFATGSDAEVAQIAKNYTNLYKQVSKIREIHDANFDLIAQGLQPARGETVKRLRKASDNAVVVEVVEVVANDPLAGEF